MDEEAGGQDAQLEETLSLVTDGITWTSTDDQIIVLDLRTSRYLAVNRSARRLWELLEQGATVSALVRVLQEEYDIDGTRAAHDVKEFVAELRERNIVATVRQ